MFLRFHNRTVADNPGLNFTEVQRLVRFHYQYMVLNDFLPRIIHSSVLNELKGPTALTTGELEFFHWKNDPFMPVEFSVAAYRLGHSMIRPGYRLNDNGPAADSRCRMLPGSPRGLTGFRAMNTAWGIDWGRFIDVDVRTYDGARADNQKRLQFAYRHRYFGGDAAGRSACSVAPIRRLPAPTQPAAGYRLGLPSGSRWPAQ